VAWVRCRESVTLRLGTGTRRPCRWAASTTTGYTTERSGRGGAVRVTAREPGAEYLQKRLGPTGMKTDSTSSKRKMEK
jgi:hypothetical protein